MLEIPSLEVKKACKAQTVIRKNKLRGLKTLHGWDNQQGRLLRYKYFIICNMKNPQRLHANLQISGSPQ